MFDQYPQLQAEGFQESDTNCDLSAGEIEANLSKLSLRVSSTELPNQSKVEGFKNIGSIFTQPTIIKTLGCKGNRQDLLKLKQLSTLYYQLLNPVYLDIVGKTIYVSFERPKDEWFHNPKPFKPSIRVLENYGTVWCDLFGYAYLPPKRAQIWTWTPTLSHIFRKIELSSLWFNEPNLKIAGINLNNLISHLAPYITVLDLGKMSMNLLYNETPFNLLEFIQQYPKLKELNIHHNSRYDMKKRTGIPNPFDSIISLTELEVLFQRLPRGVKVNLTVYRYHEPVLERFGNVAGITIFIRASDDAVQPLIGTYGNLRNVKFNVSVHPNVQEIVQFTSLCLKHKEKININSMSLQYFPGQSSLEATIVNQCLNQLSPFITYLSLEKYYHLNILTPSIFFPRVTSLHLWSWEHSLDFLFGFPELRFLSLVNLDQNLNIFHNPEKSHKEALRECFGKLQKLNLLYIFPKWRTETVDKIGPGTELEAYLKELLPKDARICHF